VNRKIAVIAIIVAFVGSLGVNQMAFAAPEVVFSEDFDGTLTGWSQTICDTNHGTQVCSLIQATEVHNPWNSVKAPPPSAPNWGGVNLQAIGSGSLSVPIEVRYEKTFSVTTEDDYQVSAVLGVTDCSQCVESTQLFIDGNQIFSRSGVDVNLGPQSPQTTFFESTTVHLTSGVHTVGINLHSTAAVSGDFRASFDDIVIQSELSCGTGTVQVGTECVPDPDIVQDLADANALITTLQNLIQILQDRIVILEAIVAEYFPYTAEECSEFKATYDQKITDGKKIPPNLEKKVEQCAALDGDLPTYQISVYRITHCTSPGCSSSIGVSCDINDIAISGDPVGLYETPSGQTYNVFDSHQATENSPNDSWRWNFEYSGAPLGEREGLRLHATCMKPVP
jgi:hypothetical protein